MKVLANGQLYEMNTRKAITTIPGWAEAFNSGGGKETSVIELYRNSVWAKRCVDVKADAMAGIPWGFFKGEEEVENRNVSRLLEEANTEQNWSDVVRGICADMDIFGEAYIEKVRLNPDSPFAGIARLNAGTMRPVVDVDGSGIVGFVQKVNGRETRFEREEIVYFHSYNPEDDHRGHSNLATARYAIQTEINANRYAQAFFANNAIPPVVLWSEQVVAEPDMSRIRRWWDKTFKGVDKQHKVAIMDRGLKPEILGYPLNQLALQEVRAEARRDICAALGVPPALAGAWEAANYAASAEQRESFYTEGIIPRAKYFESVLNAELIADIDAGIEFRFKINELDVMQPDMVSERASIAGLVSSRVIKPEVAAVELGYQESDAGDLTTGSPFGLSVGGAIQRSDNPMAHDLGKWEKKAINAYAKKGSAQVAFDSEHIPPAVAGVIFGQLVNVKSKDAIRGVFAEYMEV